MKEGILLLNLGGPRSLDEVKPFLYRLFSDPDILVGVPTPIRQMLALMISQTKGNLSKRNYASIGGCSPQFCWTWFQGDMLERRLRRNPNWGGRSVKVEIGMRAWEPSIAVALEKLKAWGAERVTLLPLFPQFSTTTTGSCLKEANRLLKRHHATWNPEVLEVRTWADHPSWVNLQARLILQSLKEAKGKHLQSPHLLISAHSLPVKIVERGDPYPQEVQRSVEALVSKLALGPQDQWSLAFQSRNGPIPWLTPYTDVEIQRLGKEGVRNLVLAPLSFVSDHIETLQELDQEYTHLAHQAGIENVLRVPSFNDHPDFPALLEELVLERSPRISSLASLQQVEPTLSL